MTVINKQSCPSCGQSVNIRKEVLTTNLISALFRVAKWAEEKGIKEPVKRSDFSHLVSGTESNTANFAKLAWFAPEFFHNIDSFGDKKKSYYHFNFETIADFFAGIHEIATVVEVNPLAHDGEKHIRSDYRTINRVPTLMKFLNENREFVVEYIGRVGYNKEEVQGRLSFITV